MHIRHPIRFPEDRIESAPERPQSRSGVVFAVIVFAVLAALASLVLTTHGVTLPCGDDLTANCTLG